MTDAQIQQEIARRPQAYQRTPEEQRKHEEAKGEHQRQLEAHLASLMQKRGIKFPELVKG